MIYCEFNYCINNKQNECQLGTVSISPLGMCDDCIIPEIDDETLEKLKNDTLKNIAKR